MFVVLINYLFIDKVSLRVSPWSALCVLTQTCLRQVSRFEVLVHFFMNADRHSHQRLQTRGKSYYSIRGRHLSYDSYCHSNRLKCAGGGRPWALNNGQLVHAKYVQSECEEFCIVY